MDHGRGFDPQQLWCDIRQLYGHSTDWCYENPHRTLWLVLLTDEYVGKICFLNDIAERHKLYRVCKIAYWTSTKTRFANWEATLEPVHLSPDGQFYVADEDAVIGPKGIRVTKSKVLLGYILAQYIDGDDEEPTRADCVDLYIENAIDKFKA
jgi:hypothetical protein